MCEVFLCVVRGAINVNKFEVRSLPSSHLKTVLWCTMVIETVQYYTENGARPVYVLLFYASKAFDKIVFNVLFNELQDRAVCSSIIKLLYYTCTLINHVE